MIQLTEEQREELNAPDTSLVKCYKLATIRQQRILQVIGHLSPSLMQKVDAGLKKALDVR